MRSAGKEVARVFDGSFMFARFLTSLFAFAIKFTLEFYRLVFIESVKLVKKMSERIRQIKARGER